ncbi:uncharacterized protein LOC114766828 [Denticeps clupeoides]|uniref:Sushi domain-containing protein n=1 Tax=Denticeps clupeoides TaxID=299321 RepID=A0AAY4D613_9TELE|nr:uncharacterized protein LOC114766828 [Denticeps clupeoides]
MLLLWPAVMVTVGGLGVGASSLGVSVSPILLRTTSEEQPNATDPGIGGDTGLGCVPVLPPRRGSYYVEHGTGVSAGSVLVFWCAEGYQLVGAEKMTCIVHAGSPKWSNRHPTCEGIPNPDNRGLRAAVLVSVISGVVIVTMAVFFVVCCVQDHLNRKRERTRTGRSRRRDKRRPASRRSRAWLEREEGDWEVFHPPKIYNLPLPQPSTRIPVRPGTTRGHENQAYNRSQESMIRSLPPGLYHSESQIYPQLVLQRVSTPGSPAYLHVSAPPTMKAPQQQCAPPLP